MIKQIRTYFNEGNKFYGLEVSEHQDQILFHLLEVTRKKNELFLGLHKTFSNLEDISGFIKKDAPLLLTFNTSYVITKITITRADSNIEALVHNAFPNLDFESFYYDVQLLEVNTLITISKKENIDRIIEQLQKLKVIVAGFTMGVSSVGGLLKYIKAEKVHLSNAVLTIDDSNISNFRPYLKNENISIQSHDINGLIVPREQLLNFGAILTYLSKEKNAFSNFDTKTNALNREFKAKREFNLLFKIALLVILTLLFGNFIIFNHYFERVEALKTTATFNSVNKDKLLELSSIVQKKEDRVNAVLSSSNSKSSFFLDQIAIGLPSSLLFDEIIYQPLQKPFRESKPIEIQLNTMVISGQATNSIAFSNWIEQLEQLSWIKNVETLDYDYTNSNSSKFSLKLELNEN